MAVPWGSLQAQRSRVLPQGGAILGQLTGSFQRGLEQGRMRAAEDEAPALLWDYLNASGATGPTLGALATPGAPSQPTAPQPTFNGMPTQANADLQEALTPGSPTFDGRFALRRENASQQNPPAPPSSRISYNYGDGTIRNQPVSTSLEGALNQAAAAAGIDSIVINSGGQPAAGSGGARTGSTRHDHGNAADLQLIVNGRPLDITNPNDIPIIQSFISAAQAAGATGFGAGTDYMGNNTLHVGYGTPGVWGAGGSGATAPDWLQAVGSGAPAGGGASPSQAPSAPVGWQPPSEQERMMLRALIVNPVTRQFGLEQAMARMMPPEPAAPNWTIQEHNGTLYRIDANTGRVEPLVQGQPAGPEPTDDMREYQFAVSQGFTGTFPEWQMMRPPSTVVDINQPGTPMIGTIPPAWQATELEAGGYTMAPIPGGPAEIELAQQRQAAEINANFAQRQTDTLMTTLGNAEEIIQRNPGGTTGWGAYLAALPASEARTLQSLIETAQAIIGFDTLQSMREASPTGGALGAITERELAFLQSVQGSLDQGLSADVLLRNIQAIAASVQRWNQAMQAARGPGSAAQAGIPPGAPTATNPQTGEVVYWNGTAWVAP